MPATSSKAFNKSIGSAIKKRRLLRGLTQADVARALDVSYQQIQKSEAGINAFSAHQLTKIAEFFEVPVAQLFEEAGVKMVDQSEPSPAESAGYLAARYVQRIADPKLRSNVVDFARKLAYSGGAA